MFNRHHGSEDIGFALDMVLHQRVVYDVHVHFCRLSQYVESITTGISSLSGAGNYRTPSCKSPQSSNCARWEFGASSFWSQNANLVILF